MVVSGDFLFNFDSTNFFTQTLKFYPINHFWLESENANNLFNKIPNPKPVHINSTASSPPPSTTAAKTFHGLCYVLRDNIDTGQIIPKPEEYRMLGSYALIDLPSTYTTRFIEPGEDKSKYSIVIGGENFGCGSSREHAPVALGAAVVAELYARIFFRNSVATGEVYPFDSEGRLCDECSTGDVVTIEVEKNLLINHTTGNEYKLKPIGDAGGIFAYARKTGMIPSAAPA